MTIAELIAAAKTILKSQSSFSLDDSIWGMLATSTLHKADNLRIEGHVIDNFEYLKMLAHEAEKYAMILAPQKNMALTFSKPILMMKPEALKIHYIQSPEEPVEPRPVRRALFISPKPPDGYQVQVKISLSGGLYIWVRCPRIFGVNDRKRYFARNLPEFYVRRSAAEKTLKELQKYNPGREYRIEQYWIP